MLNYRVFLSSMSLAYDTVSKKENVAALSKFFSFSFFFSFLTPALMICAILVFLFLRDAQKARID